MTTRRSRTSRAAVMLVALMAVGGVLSACGPDVPSTPGDPSTPWLAAGCLSSAAPGVPDFRFNGIANAADNAHGLEVGGVLSEDGTCTGTPTDYNSVVRAVDAAGAVAICASLDRPVVDPPRLIDFGYNVPIDAWACIDAPAAT